MAEELSPLMQQYLATKQQYPDTIVFFRVGDFYEMFFDDAVNVSRVLDLTLTGKDCGMKERAPMCGVPFHSYETYAARLIAKGYKVAICEQTEDPSKTKKLVRREVIRVITPGTVMEQSMLEEGSNNYIASVYQTADGVGLVFCDISTGELSGTMLEAEDALSSFKNELLKYSPRELLLCGSEAFLRPLGPFLKEKLSACVNMLEASAFDYAEAERLLLSHFKVSSLEELGLKEMPLTVSACGALFGYLSKTQRLGMERIGKFEVYREEQYVRLDYNTRRNLELVEPLSGRNRAACLLSVLDQTKTSMGRRLMKSIVEKPLCNLGAITRRQNAVAELVEDVPMRSRLREELTGLFDIQRVITRIVYGSANARELRSLCGGLKKLPAIRESMSGASSGLIRDTADGIDLLTDIVELIDSTITEDPPFSVREGGMIRTGCSSELDELRHDMTHSSDLMAKVEAKEREQTGIPKLKIGYNRVFGYYIEVSNAYKNSVPASYIRKQTLTNGERYITEELKNLERRLLGAKDRANELEYAIFDRIRKKTADAVDRISAAASSVALLDVLAALAQAAFDYDYVCPALNAEGRIEILDGRHPVVERLLPDGSFVPNDTFLDLQDNRLAIITGPNMAGKSTYMRQTALIVLMAQMGSFVPARRADISITDSVFTRIGASDDLSSGQSTFMVEMNEVAYILKNATPKSLLILDEIGRGTSTYDGMCIARSVLEYAADRRKIGAKTLFATHYHELTVLADTVQGVKNYNIAAIKHADELTFLRRILPGAADESYGIEVAKLAGLPDQVIEKAKSYLKEMEGHAPRRPRKKKEEPPAPQLTIAREDSPAEKRLREIDVNNVTPMEAMNLLFELIKLLNV